ncbi:unnamed protein product [Prunus armeniaca]
MAMFGSLQAIGLNPAAVIGTLRPSNAVEVGELFIGRFSFLGNVEHSDYPYQRYPEVRVVLTWRIADMCQYSLHCRLQRQPNSLEKDIGKENDLAVLRLAKGFGRRRDPHPY